MQEKSAPAASAEAAARGADESQATRGFFFALSAYGLWGVLPLYLKAVAHIPAHEVLAHRILWSVPVAGILLLVLRRTADIRAALRSPRTLAMAALTAGIIATNWGRMSGRSRPIARSKPRSAITSIRWCRSRLVRCCSAKN